MAKQRSRVEPGERHSEPYFGRQRDFWWNADFLGLMAARWKLADVQSLADIGCGVGHWSRLLYPYLRADARVTGVDREQQWLRDATEAFDRAFPQAPVGTFATVAADAASLPLPDNQFAVVTCQTLLMHLPDPLAALREMVRITRPGGLVIAVEPNNFSQRMSFNSLTWEKGNDELVRRFRFWLCYHRGKIRNGDGDDTIGELLPGYFSQLALNDIQVYGSDKAAALYPPYATDEQRVMLNQQREWFETQTGPWDPAQLRRHVLAGGGSPDLFEQVVADLRRAELAEQAANQSQRLFAAGGSLVYLVSGRKPE